MNIGNKIELRKPFSNEVGEYELVSIHESGDYIFKGEGLTTLVISEQCLRYLGINNKKVKYMNFIEAIKLIELDDNVTIMRRSKDVKVFPFGKNKILTCGSYGEIFKPSINDILAEDWYVVKDEKLHTFEEAIASLRKGKSIRRKTWINRFSVDADDNNYYFNIDDLNANDWIIKERN